MYYSCSCIFLSGNIRAFLEFFIKQPLVAFGQGALSAGIMQGLANTVGMMKQKHADKQIAAIEAGRYLLTTEAQEFDDLSPAAQKIVKENFSDHPQDLQKFIQQKSPTGSLSKEAQMAIDAAVDVSMGKDNRAAQGESVKQRSNDERTDLVTKLRKHSQSLQSMPVVARLGLDIFKKGPIDLKTQVSQFFKSIGNKVHRDGFGDVILDENGIGSSMGHGIGRAKSIAFRAVPEVIAHGKQIDYQPNWKGRGKDTYIFAAPITIGNQPCIMGVIVDKNTKDNRYYLHEAIDNEGNIIIIKKDESDNIKTESFAEASPGVSQSSFEEIVSQPTPIVNTETSPKTDIEAIADDLPMRHVDGSVRSYKEYAAEQEAKKQETPPPADTEAPTANPDIEAAVNAPGVKRAEDIDLQYIQRLKGKNAMLFKDLPRVLDYVCDKMPGVRDFWRNRVEKPFWAAKASFARRTEAALRDLKNLSDELGIYVGSKESAATQWYGEGYRTVQKKNPMYEIGGNETKYVSVRDDNTLSDLRNKKSTCICKCFFHWSCLADLNCRPLPYQGSALPTELRQHNNGTYCNTEE